MVGYDDDYLAWLREQAEHLRARRLHHLDAEHLADELSGLARSAERALADEVAQVLAVLALQRFVPVSVRGDVLDAQLHAARAAVAYSLRESPSAARLLTDPDWIDVAWSRAVALAVAKTGLDCFPASCPWRLPAVMQGVAFPSPNAGGAGG